MPVPVSILPSVPLPFFVSHITRVLHAAETKASGIFYVAHNSLIAFSIGYRDALRVINHELPANAYEHQRRVHRCDTGTSRPAERRCIQRDPPPSFQMHFTFGRGADQTPGHPWVNARPERRTTTGPFRGKGNQTSFPVQTAIGAGRKSLLNLNSSIFFFIGQRLRPIMEPEDGMCRADRPATQANGKRPTGGKLSGATERGMENPPAFSAAK